MLELARALVTIVFYRARQGQLYARVRQGLGDNRILRFSFDTHHLDLKLGLGLGLGFGLGLYV